MIKNKNNSNTSLRFYDLIPRERCQLMQDRFSGVFDIAAVSIDDDGAFTKTSNCGEFCKKLKQNPIFENLCKKCQKAAYQKAKQTNKSVIKKCYAGLYFSVTPIVVDEKTIGAVILGQVFVDEPDEKTIQNVSNLLEITRDEYIQQTKNIKRVTSSEFNLIEQSIYLNTLNISDLVYQDHVIARAEKQDTFLRKISKKISKTVKEDELFESICKESAKIFNVQRAYIVSYDNNKCNLITDYRVNQDIKGMIDVINSKEKYEKHLLYWMKKMINQMNPNQNIVIFSKSNSRIEYDNPTNTKITDANTGIAAIISSDYQKYSAIILEEYEKDRIWSFEEQELLKTLAENINIIIKQSILTKRVESQVEREQSILNNLPFSSWLKDISGKYTFVNEAYLKWENLRIRDVIGKTDKELFKKAQVEEIEKEDKIVIETKEQMNAVREMLMGKEKKRVQIFKAPIKDKMGNVIAIAGCMIDVTHIYEMERLKDEFISIVSHELRTPLTSIMGSLELVEKGVVGDIPQKASDLLNIAINNSMRLHNLINDILDIEKIEAGKMDYAMDNYCPTSIINKTISEIDSFAKKFKSKIIFNNNAPYAIIKIDSDRLEQILTNLTSNAIKYSDNTRPVIIESRIDKDIYSISVKNFGNKIPKEAADLLFKKFSQIDASNKRKKGGTGLGLSISKLLTEEMNGVISFKSDDNGTVFTIEFPLSQDNA